MSLNLEEKFKIYFPDLKLCTDNAAMIALAGLERYKKKKFDKNVSKKEMKMLRPIRLLPKKI